MSRRRGRPVLPFVYFLLVSVLALGLGVLGYLIDRLPVVPASVSRAYQRALLAAVAGLSRPVDGWAEAPRDSPVGEPTVETPP